MTTLQILKRGLKRIQKGWTRGIDARNSKGLSVNTCGGRPTCWCARGAVDRDMRAMQYLQQALPADAGTTCVVTYNDRFAESRRDIVSLFKRAIKGLSNK